MKKRLVAILLTAVMCGSMLAACGDSSDSGNGGSSDTSTTAGSGDTSDTSASSGGSEADGDLVIYGIYKSGDQTWFLDEGDAAKAAVEAAGGTFNYIDARMDGEEEMNAIDNAIANNADGIVICTSDQTMSQAIVDKCEEAGIPVVAADDALQDAEGNKLAPWVGIDAYNIGAACGEWIANYAMDNDLVGKDNVGLLMMTMDTVSSCVPRTEGEFDKFTEMVPDFDENKIFRADYDGTTDKGNTAATAVITGHPEITQWLVVAANEEGAIGAVRSLESAGLDKDACVVGLGAYMAKDEWNDKGADGVCMKASAYFPATAVGEGSIEVLLQLINGEEPEMETAVAATMVTPENYKEVMGKDAE